MIVNGRHTDVGRTDGILMGSSMEDVRKRESIIIDFLSKWHESNADGKILNEALRPGEPLVRQATNHPR